MYLGKTTRQSYFSLSKSFGSEPTTSARSNDLCGIVNGLDNNDWNPDTDHRIAKTFNVENFRKNKPVNKAALQEELGLDKDNHEC